MPIFFLVLLLLRVTGEVGLAKVCEPKVRPVKLQDPRRCPITTSKITKITITLPSPPTTITPFPIPTITTNTTTTTTTILTTTTPSPLPPTGTTTTTTTSQHHLITQAAGVDCLSYGRVEDIRWQRQAKRVVVVVGVQRSPGGFHLNTGQNKRPTITGTRTKVDKWEVKKTTHHSDRERNTRLILT